MTLTVCIQTISTPPLHALAFVPFTSFSPFVPALPSSPSCPSSHSRHSPPLSSCHLRPPVPFVPLVPHPPCPICPLLPFVPFTPFAPFVPISLLLTFLDPLDFWIQLQLLKKCPQNLFLPTKKGSKTCWEFLEFLGIFRDSITGSDMPSALGLFDQC